MVSRPARFTAVVAALAFGLVGCSGNSGGTGQGTSTTTTAPSESGGSADAVAWAEKVCSSVGSEVKALSEGPNVDPTNPERAKTGLVTYLDTLGTALDRMIGGIKGAGAPPVPEGQTAAARAIGTLEQAKSTVDSAKTNLQQANVADPAGLQAAIVKVGEDLQALGELEDPTKDLRGNEELDAAFKQAKSCQELSGDGASSSATTSATEESASETASATPTSTSR